MRSLITYLADLFRPLRTTTTDPTEIPLVIHGQGDFQTSYYGDESCNEPSE